MDDCLAGRCTQAVILMRTMSAKRSKVNPTRRTGERRGQRRRGRGMKRVSLDDVRGYMGVDPETAARIRERSRFWVSGYNLWRADDLTMLARPVIWGGQVCQTPRIIGQ